MTEVKHPQIFHSKCVCQICTCSKHRCPHAELDVPLASDTIYSNDFHKHPLHVWTKPKEKGPPEDRHYDYINSAYREHYPGHQVGARDKYKPRVKDEDSNLPFNGGSEYRTNYGPKSSKLEGLYKRHDGYRPTNQPFESATTYKSDFNKKPITNKEKKPYSLPLFRAQEINFPPGYRFDDGTTYGKSYVEHPVGREPNYKPAEKISEKGPHDLNTIYRQDFQGRPGDHKCPIFSLPRFANKIRGPNSHLGYDSTSNQWVERA